MATPRLSLSHTTVAVRDLDVMVDFYTDVLGFHVTNRGTPGPGQPELAFLSQDPSEHHQMVFLQGETPDHHIVFADHLAFRTGSLDDLRTIGERLAAAGVEQVHPVSHGNAWSLYFNDPEGNGLECFVDSPFHVAQPYLRPARSSTPAMPRSRPPPGPRSRTSRSSAPSTSGARSSPAALDAEPGPQPTSGNTGSVDTGSADEREG